MAIDYALKYASKIDERFKIGATTTPLVNNDYEFAGVQTVKVYSIPTIAMGDYAMTGSNRYGTPGELQNVTQELTMTRDRAFTFTVDKRNNTDTQGAQDAGVALRRQLDEVVIPEVDMYRIGVIVASAGNTATGTIAADGFYSAFLDGQNALTNAKVPLGGRVAVIGASFYKGIRRDDSFIKAGDLSQDMLLKGQVGAVDGIPLLQVPDSYVPAGFQFCITRAEACVAPVKLSEYKIHDNPPGINGWLVEGRIYYDAFVLNNKAAGIYAHVSA